MRVIGRNNLEHSTTTDSEGVYTFQDLPADTYRLEVEPPAGMGNWQFNRGETYKIEIGAKGVAGCPLRITFAADGRIKGKVVDEEGNGVAGYIITELVDEKEAEVSRRRGGMKSYTTENGEFDLWLLRPARYRLVFRPRFAGQVYQVTPVRSEVITIGMGQRIEDFRFKVPAIRP